LRSSSIEILSHFINCDTFPNVSQKIQDYLSIGLSKKVRCGLRFRGAVFITGGGRFNRCWTKNGAFQKYPSRPSINSGLRDGHKVALLFDAMIIYLVEAYQHFVSAVVDYSYLPLLQPELYLLYQ
jgi:hypothetical protein